MVLHVRSSLDEQGVCYPHIMRRLTLFGLLQINMMFVLLEEAQVSSATFLKLVNAAEAATVIFASILQAASLLLWACWRHPQASKWVYLIKRLSFVCAGQAWP